MTNQERHRRWAEISHSKDTLPEKQKKLAALDAEWNETAHERLIDQAHDRDEIRIFGSEWFPRRAVLECIAFAGWSVDWLAQARGAIAGGDEAQAREIGAAVVKMLRDDAANRAAVVHACMGDKA